MWKIDGKAGDFLDKKKSLLRAFSSSDFKKVDKKAN